MLRTIPVLLLALLLPVAVLAEEVELKLNHDLSKDTPFYMKRQLMNFRLLHKAPAGAVAPEHKTLIWGILNLGAKAYNICIGMEQLGAETPLVYVDRDNDLNLKEETPVQGEMTAGIKKGLRYQFVIRKLPAEFTVQETKLEPTLNILFMFIGARFGQICPLSAYRAKVNALGRDYFITWIPGQEPVIQKDNEFSRSTKVFAGRSSFKLDEKCLKIKSGKVFVTYTTGVDNTLVAVSIPDGITSVNVWGRSCGTFYCKPEDGKIYLPECQCRISLEVEKSDGKNTWKITFAIRRFNVTEGAKVEDFEPLSIRVTKYTLRGFGIRPVFADAKGRKVVLYRNGKMFSPDLVIKDSAGSVVEVFKTGYS